MENKETKALYEKIRKLMALQLSAEKIGSLEEASNAALRIQELLMKYNLDLGEVKDAVDENRITEQHLQKKDIMPKNEGKWLINLIKCIAKHNLCKLIFVGPGNNNVINKIKIIGKTHNIELVLFIIDQLKVRARVMAKNSYKKNAHAILETKNVYIRGYLDGFVKAINEKLSEEASAQTLAQGNVYGLIVSNANAIGEYLEQKGVILMKANIGNTAGLYGVEGKIKGYKDGLNTNIHKGVYNSNTAQKLLN